MHTQPRTSALALGLCASLIGAAACSRDSGELDDDPFSYASASELVHDTLVSCLVSFADAPERYEPIVHALCSEQRSLEGVGVSLAIAEDGVLTYSGGHGPRCADTDDADVVDGATAYRVGSISKLFTAALAAALVDSDELELDAPIALAVPELASPSPAHTITLRQLLTHTAGLDELDGREPELWTQGWLTRVREAPLRAPPGSTRRYNNTGFYVVGAALERVSGLPFGALVERDITGPLSLTRTTARPEHIPALEIACDHASWLDSRRRAFEVTALTPAPPGRESDWIVPAGGVLASAEDLVALALALPDRESWTLLRARQRVSDLNPELETTLAGRVRVLSDGTPAYRQSGNTGAQAAELHWIPALGFAIAVTANTGKPYRATIDAAYRVVADEPAYGPVPEHVE